ncbi:MAG: hypothetical protein HY699_00545 [Deltaproteobacteria bacterium]|nr:hypothetical protein [Deltaproteobacteria bacterium]
MQGPKQAQGAGVMLLLLALAAPLVALAVEPAGSSASERALALCDALDDRPSAGAQAQLARALELAEQAVTADAGDAKAHFAVFCALAKRTYLAGYSLGSLFAVRRLHREIDATLALAPDYSDALVAKAAFLLNLPRLLGGDVPAAQQLLLRVLAVEPDRISARLYLAEALFALEAPEAARAEAQRALASAGAAGRPAQVDEARALLARFTR